MSSLLGHALAGLTVSAAFTQGRPSRRVGAWAVACAVAPDLDWFADLLPALRDTDLAHRGLGHSLLAAALLATLAMGLGFRDRLRSPRLWGCMGAAAISHGLLDACTFGGTAVGFLLPFSSARFISLWQPLFVTPIPVTGRLFEWLCFSLATELAWIGTPALLVFGLPRLLARLRARRELSEEAAS